MASDMSATLDPLSALASAPKPVAKAATKPPPSAPAPVAEFDVAGILGRSQRVVPKPATTGGYSSAPALSHASAAAPAAVARAPLVSAVTPAASVAAGASDVVIGEKVLESCALKNVFAILPNYHSEIEGMIACTDYRFSFRVRKAPNGKSGLPASCMWMHPTRANFFDVPFGLVAFVEPRTRAAAGTGMVDHIVDVRTKDFRQFSLNFRSDEEAQKTFVSLMDTFAFPGGPSKLFCCKAGKGPEDDSDRGWQLYDPHQEYLRLGCNEKSPWEISALNMSYRLCATYPQVLVFPRDMSEKELTECARFRKKNRLITMSWCSPELNYASLWRCSQGTEGFGPFGKGRCPEDEKMLKSISRSQHLLVLDLRPYTTALACKAFGKGGMESANTQDVSMDVKFGNMHNIHHVRNGWRDMGAAVGAVRLGSASAEWWGSVASSHWYDYVGVVLQNVLLIMDHLSKRQNVVIHCSDGWDRTAQASSLVMICMDAEYRSIRGFCKVIQKEFCSFGHQFKTRAAVGHKATDEASPIFVQWLDCVYQILRQFPDCFEFGEDLLLRLTHEVYSNRYGTFLEDCEALRTAHVQPYARSLWPVLLTDGRYRNPGYNPRVGQLRPRVHAPALVVWERYWFRYHEHGNPEPTEAAPMLAPVVEQVSAAPIRSMTDFLNDEEDSPPEANGSPSRNAKPARQNRFAVDKEDKDLDLFKD
mmetsp:Transcript_62383/g.143706  ORF Transcript_62383/g.143706 Transcript_62383/m.143706 type:complete len:703 (+) Transcript_62383:59-2167(+)